MRKIFTFMLLFIILKQYATGQNVTSSYINFTELAAYEASHPDLFKICETCPKRENDDWEPIDNPNMPFPPGAKIKRQPLSNIPAVPMIPSGIPVQNWIGAIDPGTSIPPDTHGAVGINHVITATNNYIRIHNKVGGSQVSQVTVSTFTGVAGTCDPYMIFDPSAQRWIFSAINCSMSTNNPMILMVSNSPDPTGTWRRITWVPTGGPLLLDHPYVGFDGNMIVVSGRRFQNGTTFVGCSLFLIDKAAMMAGTAITFGTNAQQIDKTGADGDAPLPVTVYDPPFSNVGNPSPGTFYILQSWNGSSIRLTTVTGNIPAATWNTGTAVFPSGGTPWNAGAMGNSVEQVTETRKLAANDARISCGIMMNGKIWCSHHIAFPTAGTPNRIAVQWWQLDATPGAGFGNVLQRGRVGGNNPNEYKWFSSITVNKDEDVLIGYSSSNLTSHVNSAYVTREASTPLNTTDDEFIYKTGINRYWKDFGSGRARWGDYSHCSLDPVDNSLWTIQEYAELGIGAIPPDNNSRFGVWWAQIAPTAAASSFTFTSTTAAVIACNGPSNADISLGTNATNGFSTPINLSAISGVPVGTSVSFSVNPLVPGSSTVVTLNNTNVLANGTYNITIQGVAGAVTQTAIVTYTVSAGAGPVITGQPANIAVCAGSSVSFTVTATGTTGYQWQVNTGAGFNNITGATTATYNIAAVNATQNGYIYHCVLTGQCNSTTSANATLTVNTAPAITTQPVNATVCAGSNATFTVAATGTGLSYQWQVSSTPGCAGPWSDIAAANSASYTVVGVTVGMDNTGYHCVVSGTCPPPATSNCALLTVGNAAAITDQPANTTVCEGANASFTVTATGTISSYQWQVNTGAGFNDIPGATAATLNLPAVTVGMSGYQYRVNILSCTAIPITSTAATLTVNTLVTISAHPASSTLCLDANASFSVTAAGTGLTYQWQYAATCAGAFSNIPGATSATLNLGSSTLAQAGAYRVVVTGTCNSVTSSCVTLVVNSPITISVQPADVNICLPLNTASFSVTAAGTGLTYQWQLNTGTGFANIAGETNATLNLTGITVAMNGYQYRVVLNGTCTANLNSATATLAVNSPVNITSQPQSVSVCDGSAISFSVVATGSTITYQWQVSINGGPFVNVTNTAPFSGATTATLNINPVTTVLNGYVFQVIVSGVPCGAVTSDPATLTANALPVVVLTAASYTNITPYIRTTLYTTVSPPGIYIYRWFRDGVLVPSITADKFSVTVDDLGVYHVVVTDINGCTGTSNTTAMFALASGQLFIYPNPNTGQFQVRFYSSDNNTVRTLNIYDGKGARIYTRAYPISGPYTKMDVNMDNAESGVYLVELRDANGKRLATGKVLLQR